ncbi:unnamed protein product, partial [Laminaria digitata]
MSVGSHHRFAHPGGHQSLGHQSLQNWAANAAAGVSAPSPPSSSSSSSTPQQQQQLLLPQPPPMAMYLPYPRPYSALPGVGLPPPANAAHAPGNNSAHNSASMAAANAAAIISAASLT